MEPIDSGLQQRVWQRVRSAPSDETPQPQELLLEERTDEVQLRHLGWNSTAAQTAARIAVLQGLCRLSGQAEGQLMPKPEQWNDPLRRLVGRLLRRHRQYEALAAHPEYGTVYDALAHMTQTSVVTLLKQCGSTPLRNRRK